MPLLTHTVLLAAVAAVASLAGLAAYLPPTVLADKERLLVTIVDAPAGDIVSARLDDGRVETVRLIGLDAPEPVSPDRPARCFGAEAADRVRRAADLWRVPRRLPNQGRARRKWRAALPPRRRSRLRQHRG